MNIEIWQFILTVVGSVIGGGWISAFIAVRYARRNALANTKKNEAEALQEEHRATQEKANAESTIIANTKEMIQLYQDGITKLTELHEKQSRELEERCVKIERQWKEDKRIMQGQIDALKKDNMELKAQLEIALANSSKAELTRENAKLKLENKELKQKLAKAESELKLYKNETN